MFGTFDNGNKGHLESRELGACFRCFGYVATEADMQEIVNEVGGTVDFQQFTHIMTRKMKDCDGIGELKQVFKQVDMDGDQYISAADLRLALSQLAGQDLRPEEIEELMREADVDGDGRISLLDFTNVMTA